MKRWLSALLGLMLLLGIAASTTVFAEDEVVDLTLFYPTSRSTNEFTDLIHQWAIDNLGINLIVTPGSQNEWKQQLALYMTSGDVPDVIAYMDEVTYRTYAAENAWYDITDMIDEYPNIKAFVAKQTNDPDAVWARMSVNGRIYGIPYMSGLPVKYLNCLRQDWMDKLGLEAPTTLEELTDILRAFTFDDPDGNGINDTYGFGCQEGLAYLTEFFGAFGATPLEDTFIVDGEMVTNVISDNFRAALEYLHGIYDEGLIYPQIFTQTANQNYESWVRGTYGVVTWWWTHAKNSITRYNFFDANLDADMSFFDPVTGPDGYTGHVGTEDVANWVAISAKSQHADAALRLLDCQSTFEGYMTFWAGPRGQFWEGAPETETLTWHWSLEGKDKSGNPINDMEFFKIIANSAWQNLTQGLLPSSKQNDILKEQTVRVLTAYPYKNVFAGLTTPEYLELSSETQKYYTDATIKFITGEKDLDEEWDAYVAGYLEIGGEKIRQSLLALYNERNGTSYEFAK